LSVEILLVDDSRITRTVQARMIRMLDLPIAAIHEASDGLEALLALDEHPGVSLVVCDLNMPNMDGESFVRELQRTDRGDLDVVILTSDRSVARTEALLDAGARAYITKPATPELLRDVLSQLLAAA